MTQDHESEVLSDVAGALTVMAVAFRFTRVSRSYATTLLVVLLTTMHLVAGDLRLEGTMTTTLHLPTGTQTNSQEFDCIVDPRFKSGLFKAFDPKRRRISQLAVQDGNLYSLKEFIVHTNNVLQTNTNAEIEHRESPREDATRLVFLWLAFGSAEYLADASGGQLRPVWRLDDPHLNDTNYTLRAFSERLPTSLLPRSITYFGDGALRVTTGKGIEPIPLREPLRSSFTNAEYKVHRTMIVAGVEVPECASFRRYGVRLEQMESYLLMDVQIVVNRTAMLPASLHFRPSFDGTIRVMDFRFSRSNPPVRQLVYGITNGVWKSVDELGSFYRKEVAVVERIQAAKEREMRRKRLSAMWSVLWLVLLLVPVLIYGAFYVKRKSGE